MYYLVVMHSHTIAAKLMLIIYLENKELNYNKVHSLSYEQLLEQNDKTIDVFKNK